MLLGLAPILGVVAPVLLCASVGFVWARTGQPYDRAGVNALISTIGAPCLVFHSLVSLGTNPAMLVRMSGAAALSIASFILIGAVVLRVLGLPRHTYLSPLVFTNGGNMGLAICSFAFPAERFGSASGLALGSCYFAVAALLHFTLGAVIWAGRFSPRELARMPLVWAALLSAVVVTTGLPVPRWLLDTTDLLGGFSIPLMLLTLGVALSELRIHNLSRSVLLSMVRLGMGAAVGFGLAELLGFDGVARGVLVIECAMPSAVFNVLFAEQYQRDPGQVASLVVVSTVLSFLTLPLLLAQVI